MPRRRKLPDYVALKIPTYEPADNPLELIFDGRSLEIAYKVLERIKKQGRLYPDDYKEMFHDKSDQVLYFRVIKKMLALKMLKISSDKSYILSDGFSNRMETIAKLWKFQIGDLKDLW